MNPTLRTFLFIALAAAFVLPLTLPGPATAASCPLRKHVGTGYVAPWNPLVNSEFEYGFAAPVDTRSPLVNTLLTAVGSTVPGLTENRSEVVAPGWALRPFSGDNYPASTLRWGQHAGPSARVDPQARDGAVTLRFDEADWGPGTPILTQAVGQRPMAGAYSAPREVGMWLATETPGKPLQVLVGVYLTGDPAPTFSTKVWTPSATSRAFEHVTFPFPATEASITQIFIAFKGVDERSHGAEVVVDAVTLGAVTVRPAVDACLFPSGFPWTHLPVELP